MQEMREQFVIIGVLGVIAFAGYAIMVSVLP
jgi:hypothetical protein